MRPSGNKGVGGVRARASKTVRSPEDLVLDIAVGLPSTSAWESAGEGGGEGDGDVKRGRDAVLGDCMLTSIMSLNERVCDRRSCSGEGGSRHIPGAEDPDCRLSESAIGDICTGVCDLCTLTKPPTLLAIEARLPICDTEPVCLGLPQLDGGYGEGLLRGGACEDGREWFWRELDRDRVAPLTAERASARERFMRCSERASVSMKSARA